MTSHSSSFSCGSSLELLFIGACCLAATFCASTISLLVVVCCCHATKYDQEILLNTVGSNANQSYVQNQMCSKRIGPSGTVTVGDLINKLQTLQALIQQQQTRNNNSIGQSIHGQNSFHNSPWNNIIQHQMQLTTFQNSNNSIKKHDASASNKIGHVQVNTIQFMEFLDYQRRKQKQYLDRIAIRKKSRSDPIHYNAVHQHKPNYNLKVEDQISHSGSSENLFVEKVRPSQKNRSGEDSEISISAPLPASNPTSASEEETTFRRFVKR